MFPVRVVVSKKSTRWCLLFARLTWVTGLPLGPPEPKFVAEAIEAAIAVTKTAHATAHLMRFMLFSLPRMEGERNPAM